MRNNAFFLNYAQKHYVFLPVGNPVVLEFDSIKKPTNALDFNNGLVDFWCYRKFRVNVRFDYQGTAKN